MAVEPTPHPEQGEEDLLCPRQKYANGGAPCSINCIRKFEETPPRELQLPSEQGPIY